VNTGGFKFCGAACDTTLLLDEFAHAQPDIVLMDDGLLGAHGLTKVAQLHRALPETRLLLVGDSFELTTIYPALRLGVRGVLARMHVALRLERALRAVATGELWLSRSQLARLLTFTSIDLHEDLYDLTPRETAVMQRVLLGHSNKEVARALNIAEQTVKIHLHHIYAKLHVRRRVELLVRFRHNGH
jgi:two-component system nitrate/nitrite response regulator NarL